MVEKCEGHDGTNKRVLIVTRVVSLSPNAGRIFYSNEYLFSFDKYSTKLQEAYYTLNRYQNFVPAQFCGQRMIDGMQVSNTITI